jgi:hypothetical protein
MKLTCGQLILILSSFPPQTKVVVLNNQYGVVSNDIEVTEYEFENGVAIGIGEI